MDFNITKDSASAEIQIENIGDVTMDDIVSINSAIRKVLIKYYNMAPTLVPSGRKGETISLTLLAGSEVSGEVLDLAIAGLKKYVARYAESHVSIEQFVQKIKNDFGVLDVDIETVNPTDWCTKGRQQLPHFAIAVDMHQAIAAQRG